VSVDEQDALLEVHGLEVDGRELQGELSRSSPPAVLNVHVQGKSLVCEGEARRIIAAIFEPRLIRAGTIKLCGVPLETCLKSGEAALVPARLPVPDSAQVGKTLLMSARLIGLGAVEVDAALERCGIGRLKKRHFKGLSPVEHRLVGLAHGLTGNPRLLVLDQMFHELNQESCFHLMSLLEPTLDEKRWIAAVQVDQASSLRLMLRASQVLTFQEESSPGVLLLTPPTHFTPEAYWVHSQDPLGPLADALENYGALVAPGPSDFSLLVFNERAQNIFAQALALGISLTEMSPAQSDRFGLSRARSDA
jgi:ABC-type transport system involved in cytochrome c biogenesis ATPase subunit